MENKKESQEVLLEPGASDQVDFTTMNEIESIPGIESNLKIDENLIKELEESISEKKEEIKNKVYAVTMNDDLFKRYESFIKEDADWNGTEALGIKEINKQIQKIKKEGGIKNSVIFLGALPLEASHYFISKSKGRGLKSAEDFIDLYKSFDQAIDDAKNDAREIKSLEKDLAAAMQGIPVE
jgi:hypothetical protein